MEQAQQISGESRIQLWVVAWFVAGLATAIPHPIAILFAYAFPIGVLRVIFPHVLDFGLPFLIGAWLFYIWLTVFGLLQNRKVRFLLIYAVLCVVLVLNVVGCLVIMNEPIRDSL